VTTTSEELPAGLDPQVFSVVEGADEIYQLKAGDWPLYTFSGDAAAGDTNGQGQGDVWFVVAPDGTLIEG
jgi:predicted lipoprotein with Yx(FWY)xxD motif